MTSRPIAAGRRPPLTPEQLGALTMRSNGRGLARLAAHLAALGLGAWAIAATVGSPWMVPAIVVHGIVVVFLFAPLHESIHRTVFRSGWLNTVVAFCCGLPLLLPPRYFRAFHLEHHRHTQDPARDPELASAPVRSIGSWLLRVSGVPYWAERCRTLARHAAGTVDEPYIRIPERPRIVREARLYFTILGAVFMVSLAAGSSVLLWYWLLPAVAGQPFLRLYLMAEHGGCPQVPEMLANSRTTRSNALLRLLAWNMPYHAEHHALPSIPCHALPRAHRLFGERVMHRADGYLQVHADLLRTLRGRGAVRSSGR